MGLTSVVGDDEESSSGVQNPEKDPRKIARKYQLDLCKKAMEENIIVYLGTGCGKTHIAVLLIYELGHLIRRPQKSVCVFLAPTVDLAQQQARVIEDSIDFKVGVYSGSSKGLKSHEDWEKQMKQYEVLVMTPQILLRNLSHCFIKMEFIALLIFDECHHAQVNSNHPYAEIMREFYKSNATNLPRIFGMTASPVVGKGACSEGNLPKSINSLEKLLDAKVYSVEDKEELDSVVASPLVRVYHYGSVKNGASSPYLPYCSNLDEIRRQCISTLSRKTDDYQSLRSTKKMLNRLHDNLLFCLESLGLWGALQASRILLSGDYYERNELVEGEGSYSDDSLCDRYLAQAADMFSSACKGDGIEFDLSHLEIFKEPFFSRKLVRLIGILSTFRLQPNMKCIIFVNRIVTARSLSYILQNLKILESWKCSFLVGVHSGLKNMSRKTMNIILEKFRSGELNLLIATKVGEEGLDIQTCCLVIRYDLPETVASFIQSRGRARMRQSEYVLLVDSGNEKEVNLIENFKKDEDRINLEITSRTSSETFIGLEESTYKVDSSGASISSGYSISLLHQYCSKLPHDEFFDPRPKFFYLDDIEGTVCHAILPSNSPLHQIISSPRSSMDAAKKDACLKAIEELHKLGALNDYLLPGKENATLEEPVLNPSVSDSRKDEGSRGELHEMLVPATLKYPRNRGDIPVYLNSYYIKFSPEPNDRTYKSFGLFVKEPLPAEAQKMEIDLHLARGRSVMAKFVPSGVAEFDNDEIMLAQNFQEMFLKVILDRNEFVSEFVQLGNNDSRKASSLTFYLLLPVTFDDNENTMSIDWNVIRRCLSSPVFRSPVDALDENILPSDIQLELANGCKSRRDIENSLVYAPHKNLFFFITNVVFDKNGYSPYKDSGTLSYAEHLNKKFGIQLGNPRQPLLHAKPLFCLHNLLHNRRQGHSGPSKLDEYFICLPPEICHLKILGFSKDIGSSISLLPSIMHRVENLLVAIELKNVFSASFPEGSEVTAERVLEALTTEKCQERFSLERLEVLGDAFLKFAVGRHLFLLHDTLDEGELTRRRSDIVNNTNLFKLAIRSNLQVYIRDQSFEPSQFFALGRTCPLICNKETEGTIHSQCLNDDANHEDACEVRCSKGHHWLHKKTIADVVEALVGAFIVDSGFKAAIAFLCWIGIQVEFEASQLTNVCMASTKYIPLDACIDFAALEKSLDYQFLYKGLLLQAFVHPSYNKHGGGCYQRLEFLGDAVLDYLITSYLYSVYPNLKPGQLTDLRSLSVNNKAFANVAVNRSFQKYIICDSNSLSEAIKVYVDFVETPASERDLLDEPKCPKALGDLVESCMGAILLDTGFNLKCVWKIMLSFLDPIISFSSLQLCPIRELQELCQSYSWDLQFFPSKKGRNYSVEVKVNSSNFSVSASATNLNKKDATRNAAQQIFPKLKAEGCTFRIKSLEKVLESSCKLEAKLIGYDEMPIDLVPSNATGSEIPNVKESFGCSFDPKVHPASHVVSSLSSKSIRRLCPSTLGSERTHHDETIQNHASDTDSVTSGGSRKDAATAKSRLYEVCAANCWKPPSFECCKEEGPSHLKLFTFKVVVEIEEDPDMVLECFGSPHVKKKAAAEHAAEGALWFLTKEGYTCMSG
nr:dicer-like protein 4 [Ziziphus jujuba var. spinosa]